MVNVTDLLESKFGTPMEPSCGHRGTDSVRVSEKGKDLIEEFVSERNDERDVEKQVSNPNGVEGNHDGFGSSFSNRESGEGELVRDEEERISQSEGSVPTGNEFNGINLVDLRDDEEERVSQLEGSVLTGNEFNGINLVVDLRDEKEERVSQLDGYVQTGNEFNGINLVVDLSPRRGLDGKFNCGIRPSENVTDNKYGVGVNAKQNVVINEQAKYDVGRKHHNELRGKELRTDKEGEYEVSDLVWGKVRSHPWWPGQIFDPSAASEKAKKHCKKNGFLIAYFGDQTFAWNDASQVKPFRKHFLRMEKQSSTEAFCHAVDCALDEVSRRIEFGLACSCLGEDVYTRIKSQVVVNAGVSEESSKRVGGDNFSTAGSFVPANFFQCIKALALNPFGGTDRLEFVTARAQLLAYNRWKGYYQLSTENLVEALLESDVDEPVERQERVTEDTVAACGSDEHVTSGKREPTALDSSSRKRKHIPADSVCPSKKEKRLSDLTSGDILNLPNGKDESVKAGKSTSSSFSGRKRKDVEPLSDEPKEESAKKTFRAGDNIGRIVRRLSVTAPILKSGDKLSQKPVSGNRGKFAQAPHGAPLSDCKKFQVVKVPEAYPPSDEILSQLCLMAVDPMKENSFLTLVLRFFTDFRSYCLKNAEKISAEKAYDEGTVKSSPNSETMEVCRLIGFEDSYWTDRNVQINSENQVLFEPEVSVIQKSENEQGTVVASLESDAEKPAGHLDDNCSEYSGAALLLNFDKKASVPPVTNLNNIYSHYGPLKEVSTKNKRAKVVFERRSDAETAFSSSGKYSTFGPSLLTYSLDYSPTPRKRTNPVRKQTKEKDATPANTTGS